MNSMRALRLDDDGARFDAEHSEIYRPARQGGRVQEISHVRAHVRPSLRLEQPRTLDLTGRILYLSAPRQKPDRYWTLIAELGVLSGRPVVTVARLWARLLEKAEGKVGVARESWPAALTGVMGDNGALIVLPTEDDHLGMSQWTSLVIALRAGKPALLVDPANRLVEPEAAGLSVTGGEDIGMVLRCTWQHRPLPPLRLPTDPKELSMIPNPTSSNGRKPSRTDGLTPEQRTAANLARGKAAKQAAKQVREAAGFGKGRAVDDATRHLIEEATAGVLARPLTEFTTEQMT